MFYGHKIKNVNQDISENAVIEELSHDSDNQDVYVLNSEIVNK